MAKGKKFNAAEQHFLKKEITYKQTIKIMETQLMSIPQLVEEVSELKKQISTLEYDKTELNDHIDRLLDFCKMTPEDLKALLKAAKARADMEGILKGLSVIGSSGMFR